MSTDNGLSLQNSSLTEIQLKQLQQTLNPYLAQLRLLEYQVGLIHQMISDLTGMYFTQLGLACDLTVNLNTGRLSQTPDPGRGQAVPKEGAPSPT